MSESPAECTYFRQWRPFRREQLDIICEEGCAPAVRMHLHEEFCICASEHPLHIMDGLGRGDEIGPGGIGLINPAELHAIVPINHTACSTTIIRLAAQTVASVWNKGAAGQDVPLFSPRVVHDPMLVTELHAIFDELRRPLIALECRDRMMKWLRQLLLRYADDEPPVSRDAPRYQQGVRRVRDYLRVHVTKPVSIDALARIGSLSKYYLLRQFEREYGMSPHAYQMELRLARARTLLSCGVAPSAAAYAAGFADQSHMTRRMKATFGATPGAYARQFTGAAGKSPRLRLSAVAMLNRIDTAA